MTTNGIMHRTVEANGIHLHIAEQGDGPAVILCHGFPESWYSWRHQLAALSEAGFRAVAPDMRGYGQSDRPDATDQYTLLHLVGDMVGLVDALDVNQAAIAGHDWGAPVAWHSALLRPDRFRAVIGLSVPFQPRTSVVPTSLMPRRDDAMFFQLYFQAAPMTAVLLSPADRNLIGALAQLLARHAGRPARTGDRLRAGWLLARPGGPFWRRRPRAIEIEALIA
jgi:pimeloyl-ACP methyl ester carboxylesterase